LITEKKKPFKARLTSPAENKHGFAVIKISKDDDQELSPLLRWAVVDVKSATDPAENKHGTAVTDIKNQG
jgi:hypothetical protein